MHLVKEQQEKIEGKIFLFKYIGNTWGCEPSFIVLSYSLEEIATCVE